MQNLTKVKDEGIVAGPGFRKNDRFRLILDFNFNVGEVFEYPLSRFYDVGWIVENIR